jgi:hypothetical protein
VDENIRTTRRSLHGIAELLMAGPQHRASGTIRLRVGGGEWFGTVTDPDVRFELGDLLVNDTPYAPDGTFAEVAARIGVDVGAPEGLYKDGSGVSADEHVVIDIKTANRLVQALGTGDEALRLLAPESEPVLWPEHFDIGITVDQVNFGLSLGDGFLDEPYAYVGPWTPPEGEFWNAPFGAARALGDLGGAAAVAEFFREGQRLAAAG